MTVFKSERNECTKPLIQDGAKKKKITAFV